MHFVFTEHCNQTLLAIHLRSNRNGVILSAVRLYLPRNRVVVVECQLRQFFQLFVGRFVHLPASYHTHERLVNYFLGFPFVLDVSAFD